MFAERMSLFHILVLQCSLGTKNSAKNNTMLYLQERETPSPQFSSVSSGCSQILKCVDIFLSKYLRDLEPRFASSFF